VALVLAIDPDRTQEDAIGRLTQELAGHDVMVAGSAAEAIQLLDSSVPDLVVFPLTLPPEQERTLTNRLRALSGKDPVQSLAIPLLAAEGSQGESAATAGPRWFYWFKPADEEAAGKGLEPHRFSRNVRTSLRRGRRARTRTLQIQRFRRALPSAAGTQAAATRIALAAWNTIRLLLRVLAICLRWATAVVRTTLWPAFLRGARIFFRLAGQLIRWSWQLAKRLGAVELPGGRRLWYATPAVVLGLGMAAFLGIPRAKAWLTASTSLGVADLQSNPSGSEVFIDGNRAGTTPLSAPLTAGRHEVEFRYGGATKTETVDVSIGEHAELRVDWKRAPVGRLRVTSNPDGAAVFVDGAKRGFTPITLDDLSTGQHVVTLRHAEGVVRRTVRIKANEVASLDASIFSGWLALFAPVELQLSENGRPLKLDEQNQLMLTPGRHELRLANSAVGYTESKTVEVRPGEVTAVTIAIPRTPVTVTASSAAQVWIDGVRVGDTPLVSVPVEVGTREFVVKSPTLGERRVLTTITVKPSRIDVDFAKPEL
jgi:CheY-like chemotaxis protein